MWLSHVCFSSAKAFNWDLNHKMTKKCPSNNKKLISKDFENSLHMVYFRHWIQNWGHFIKFCFSELIGPENPPNSHNLFQKWSKTFLHKNFDILMKLPVYSEC